MIQRYLTSIIRRAIITALAVVLGVPAMIAQPGFSGGSAAGAADSLSGFNAAKLQQRFDASGLQPWEAQLAMKKAERRYIDRKYNLGTYSKNGQQRANNPPPTVQAPCTNMDFEAGNFTGWTGSVGDNSLSSNGPLQNIVPGLQSTTMNALLSDASARHTIISSAFGNDPCGGFPGVAPGGNYSVRLGGTTANYQGEILEQTFTVAPGNTAFTYQYAVVLNDGGHSAGEQPYFKIEMFDQSGNLIPCSQYYVEASGTIPGFQTCGVGTWYKPWTTVSINLLAYVAQNVTIRFTVAGCIYAGHYGYAYVDASCLPYSISQTDSLCQGSSIQIAAPPGAQSYSWAPTGQTTDTITVSTPGTYTVTMVSVTGCPSSLTHVVAQHPQPTANFTFINPNCTPNVTFTNNSTISTGSMTYVWDFGDGSPLSNTTSPSHTYPPGNYTVTLIATGPGGCADTTSMVVNPANGGMAAFSATTVCMNSPTVFTDQSQPSSGWHWDFGVTSLTNDTSNLQNPTFTYPSPGTYTVTLTAQTTPCPSYITQVITVNPMPTASFSSNANCSNTTVTFSDLSTVTNPNTIASWSWNFGDPPSGGNNTSTVQSPTHVFSASGTYTVTLTVTSSSGCVSTINLPVSVGAPPVAAFTSTPVCTNTPMQFTNQSVSANSYFWDFGTVLTTDTSSQASPSYIYTQAGTYTVTLISSAGSGCSDTATMQVTVNPGPAPSYTASQVCLGSATNFNNLSTVTVGSITNVHWDFGVTSMTNDTSNINAPIFAFPSAGTYNVTLTVTSNNGCQSVLTQAVTVNPLPTAAFTNGPACVNAQMAFTDLSTVVSGNVTSWSWDFGDGSPLGNSQNPSHGYGNSSSTYTVTLIVGTGFGCLDTVQQVVNISPTPVPLFVGDTLNGCAPLCVNFTDQSTVSTGTLTGWTWDFGDGSPFGYTQNPQHCYATAGTYSVTLTVTSNNGCAATLTIPNYITVYPQPVAAFTATPPVTSVLNTTIQFTDNSTGQPNNWVWDFGDFIGTSTIQHPTYTYDNEISFTYTVSLIVTNQYGCTDTARMPVEIQPEFTFYIPNAFTPNGDGKNDLFFGTGIGIDKYDIWIFDRWGNMIFHGQSLNDFWDGRVHKAGSSLDICQEDVYVWKVALTDVFGKNHKYIGHVTLIK